MRPATGNVGAISGASWTNDGSFGKALSFDGVNDWVTVASSSFLNFTTAMTLEAWVFPTANGSGSWRNVLIKERAAVKPTTCTRTSTPISRPRTRSAANQPNQPSTCAAAISCRSTPGRIWR